MKIDLKKDELDTICKILEKLSYGEEIYFGYEDLKDFREYLYQIACTIHYQTNQNK